MTNWINIKGVPMERLFYILHQMNHKFGSGAVKSIDFTAFNQNELCGLATIHFDPVVDRKEPIQRCFKVKIENGKLYAVFCSRKRKL